MNNVIYRIIFITITSWQATYAGMFSFDFYKKKAEQFFVSEHEQKKQLLEKTQSELESLQKEESATQQKIKQELLAISKNLGDLAHTSSLELATDETKKRRALLDDSKKIFEETERTHKQLVTTTKKLLETVNNYIENPLFSDIRIQEKSSYTFDELQDASKQFYALEKELKQVQDSKKISEQSYNKTLERIALIDQDLKQQEKKSPDEIARLEVKKLKATRDNLELKKQALAKELELNQVQEFITRKKFSLLSDDLTNIERTLWVTAADIQSEQRQVLALKQEYAEKREQYLKDLAKLTTTRDSLQKELEQINATLKQPVKEFKQVSEWIFSLADETALYTVAYLNTRIRSIDSKIELLEAQNTLERLKVDQAERKLEIMEIWATISQRRFLHDEADRTNKLTALNARKVDIDRLIEETQNKSLALTNEIALTTNALSHIKTHTEHVNSKVSHTLHKATELLQQQIETENELSKIYQATTQQLLAVQNNLNLVIQKITSSSSILQRSKGAITLEDAKSALNDLKFFGAYVATLFSVESSTQALAWLWQTVSKSAHLLNILFALLIILALYLAGITLLPLLTNFFAQKKQPNTIALTFLMCVIQFLQRHLFGCVLWSVCFYFVVYDSFLSIVIPAQIIFYLGSIGYIGYLLTSFRNFYRTKIISLQPAPFAGRPLSFTYYFVLITTSTYFLSEAFITIAYGYSPLTRILWALYSLITSGLFILLLTDKHTILALIPNHGFWAIIREQIDRYYRFFVLCITTLIILSHPFVALGNILQAFILTIALVFFINFIQELLRHYSARIFFATTDDTSRERFSSSKTWYVLFVLVSLGILIIAAVTLFAYIWGYHVSLNNIQSFFNIELYQIPGDGKAPATIIKVQSILYVIAFVFGGILLSGIFNRYVLQRIYLLLHVEIGVQNTISRISSYIFVIVALTWGLQRAGLGAWTLMVVPFLVVVAWAAKGPADDFFAYFILLVERSVKVGDYIRIDTLKGDIAGIVRKITPRSVILRRKNSFTIIVPNSKLMRSYIYNWNYSHSYVAFDDIVLTVDYGTDPEQVRDILLRIISENPLILKSPSPIVRIENFAINGYEFMMRGFLSTQHATNQWNIRSDIRFAILREFKKHNIKLASPIQSLKLETSRTSEEQ